MSDHLNQPEADADPESGSASVVTSPQLTRLILSGDIDLTMAAEFGEAISECEERALPVDIDMRHVSFMDSSGIAMVSRMVQSDSCIQPVRAIMPPDMVRFLFDVTGLSESIDILDKDPGFPA